MSTTIRVLAIEPFYGGSHRAFLDGWRSVSRHDWQLLTYSPHHWKWRMRHSAVNAAQWYVEQQRAGRKWDVIFCSSMLDLATWRGLIKTPSPPVVYYVHENQLTYPNRGNAARDLHFAFTNWTSMLAADAVWFNSAFHRRDWQQAIAALLDRMPKAGEGVTPGSNSNDDGDDDGDVRRVEIKSRVNSPGIYPIRPQPRAPSEPLSIVWAARWEHDKRPDRLLRLAETLVAAGHDFRLSVLGQSFGEVPPALVELRDKFGRWVDQWGTASPESYRETLSRADVFISTADHEFFGIAAVEAMSAGCFPLLPNGLAYPELIGKGIEPIPDEPFLYESVAELATTIGTLVQRKQSTGSVWIDGSRSLSDDMQRFNWAARARSMDDQLEALL